MFMGQIHSLQWLRSDVSVPLGRVAADMIEGLLEDCDTLLSVLCISPSPHSDTAA